MLPCVFTIISLTPNSCFLFQDESERRNRSSEKPLSAIPSFATHHQAAFTVACNHSPLNKSPYPRLPFLTYMDQLTSLASIMPRAIAITPARNNQGGTINVERQPGKSSASARPSRRQTRYHPYSQSMVERGQLGSPTQFSVGSNGQKEHTDWNVRGSKGEHVELKSSDGVSFWVSKRCRCLSHSKLMLLSCRCQLMSSWHSATNSETESKPRPHPSRPRVQLLLDTLPSLDPLRNSSPSRLPRPIIECSLPSSHSPKAVKT